MKYFNIVKSVLAVVALIAIFTIPSCKTSEREIFPHRCKELWTLASNSSADVMTKKFMSRCCELIDGNENTEDVSQGEGLCLIDLVDPPKPEVEETATAE